MFLNTTKIKPDSFASAIVKENHRTADVFRKHGIEYCCGGNWPLETVCLNNQVSFELLKKELEDASRIVKLPPAINYQNWNTDFLVNYIINVHHQFLSTSLPDTEKIIREFVEGHRKQYPAMVEVLNLFLQLQQEILPHLKYEEETIFPYILQIAHAYENEDTYAKLLVKTLRKPLGAIMKHEENTLTELVLNIRQATSNYTVQEKSCLSYSLILSRLAELDHDLLQHIYLENNVLFPRALLIEAELLK